MCRLLFEIWGQPIQAYWFFYGLSIAAAVCLGLWLAKRRSLSLGKVIVICLAAAVFAFVAGRVCAFCFRGTFSGFFNLQTGDQVSFGVIVGVLFSSTLLAHVLRLSLDDTLDGLACVLPIAEGIQRIGCFCHGCCYGPISESFFAVSFPKVTDPQGHIVGSPCFLHHVSLNLVEASASHSLPVFPIQLVATMVGFLVGGLCLWLFVRNSMKGQLIWLYFIVYGTLRFVLQWFRPNYDGHNHTLGWNGGHTLSLAMAMLGLYFVFKARYATTKRVLRH